MTNARLVRKKLICFFCIYLSSFAVFAATPLKQKYLELFKSSEFRQSIQDINKINNTKREPIYSYARIMKAKEDALKLGIPDGEEILLSLYIDKYYIDDLFGYKTKENAQISLTNLFELLDFPINVDLASKDISGWFIKETNSFTLQLPNEEGAPLKVTINGIETPLPIENYYIADGDIYIDADVINKWFGFSTKFDFSTLSMVVSSKNALPIEMKLAREQKTLNKFSKSKSVLPWKETKYQPISSPLVDIQVGAGLQKNGDLSGSYSILSSQDFAYFNSQVYLSGNDRDTLTNMRLKFTKEDPESKLLGPLKASKYEFGDVSSSSSKGSGRGFSLSNYKSNIENNKTKTFSGDIQPGWDVELYRNGILIEKETSVEDGRYEFKNIDLLFGENKFETLFYGPQGQVRTETENIIIDKNLLTKYEGNYNFSVVDTSNKLFNVGPNDTKKTPTWETSFGYSKGITDDISLSGSFKNSKDKEGNSLQNYSLNADFSVFDNFLFGTGLSLDQDLHKALSFNARTTIYDQSLNFKLGFSDAYSSTDPDNVKIAENYEVNMGGRIFEDYPTPINYMNNLKYNKNNLTGSSSFSFQNQIAFSTRFGAISNFLKLENSSNPTQEDKIFGGARFSRRFGSFFTDLNLDYSIKPEVELSQINLSISKYLTDTISSELNLDYSPQTYDHSARLSVNLPYDAFDIQAFGKYDQDDNWSIGFNTHFSIGYEPVTKQFFTSKNRLAGNGVLVARVFKDDNLNGIFDEGEDLVPNVRIKALQSYRQAETNKDGVAVLEALQNNRKTDIVIIKNSIEDPFIVPANKGSSITPRAGFMNVMDIPVVNAGELDGTIYLKNTDGNEEAGAYVTINLHDQDGNLIATTDSEFDGYYLFVDLIPGKYTASISTDDLKRKKLRSVEAKEFNFSSNGDVFAGADFIIDRFTFVKGFVVELGEFNSLVMLKAYWQIIQEKYDDALRQQVFYIFDEETSKYHLNAGFFKTKSQADRASAFVNGKEISSSVKEFTFNI